MYTASAAHALGSFEYQTESYITESYTDTYISFGGKGSYTI